MKGVYLFTQQYTSALETRSGDGDGWRGHLPPASDRWH